jgi:hypothetical protein
MPESTPHTRCALEAINDAVARLVNMRARLVSLEESLEKDCESHPDSLIKEWDYRDAVDALTDADAALRLLRGY